MQILFKEEFHDYVVEGLTAPKLLKSVSKFLDVFIEPFDEIKQAEAFVTSKNNKKKLASTEEVLAYWKFRRDLGSDYHAKREAEDLALGAIGYERNKEGHKICMLPQEIRNLKEGVYTELTLPYFGAWLIGTADRIEILPGKLVNIRDYKSNGEKLKETPIKYYNKVKKISEYKYFKHPIGHQPCDTFQKYIYQLSTYGYFLEQLGFTINKLEIEGIELDDNGVVQNTKVYEVPYRKADIEAMIKYYKTKTLKI